MKNLKISKKLIIAFGSILILFVACVILSVYSVRDMFGKFDTFYNDAHQVVVTQLDMRRSFQSSVKNILWSTTTTDLAQTQKYIEASSADLEEMKAGLDVLNAKFDGDMTLVSQFTEKMTASVPYKEQIYEYALKNDVENAMKIYNASYAPLLIEAQNYLTKIGESATASSAASFADARAAEVSILIILISLAAFSFIIILLFCVYITRSLTKPINELKDAAVQMSQGMLNVSVTYQSKDELGQLADCLRLTFAGLRDIVEDVGYLLGEMGNGNFAIKSKATDKYISDFAPLLLSMRSINNRLSDTLSQINQSADQVSSGSDQVSSGAQALSQGATEQASSVQELAATITEISAQVKDNATNAIQASSLANSVGEKMTQSNEQMHSMIAAMDEISNASSEIGKIIKTIEDIAFQTNILALNAAVEAARAGAAGKGFAVVADEVRNLASKSAEASKNTAALIESSIHAVENGTKIADETAKSLLTAVEGTREVTSTIDRISEASSLQAQSIVQVTMGVDQISSVVQTNSATAEESAAASEELSSQAAMLKQLVSRFILKEGGDPAEAAGPEMAAAPVAYASHDNSSKY